jgi:sugar phosphate isomerase/epimerase
VADRVLLSASPANIEDCTQLALQHDLGIEVMAFAYPHILDGNWREVLDHYKRLLAPVSMITMHGPFLDMAPGSPDDKINELVASRYRQAIDIGEALGAQVIVFHANFIAAILTDDYRTGWQQRNVVFWEPIAEYAARHHITAAVENMWEFDPDIIVDVLKAVDHPNLRACLDVGHANLFSKVPFDTWLTTVEPWLVHAHLNNNDGKLDIHRAIPDGILNYAQILEELRSLPTPPSMTLEMDKVQDMAASLPYFEVTRHSPVSSDEPR